MAVPMSELRRIPLFATAPRVALAAIAAAAQPRAYRRGEVLFRAGDACDGIAVVAAGYVRLFHRCPSGVHGTVGIVRSGGLLGLAALRGRTTHDHSAEALCAVRVVCLPTAALRDLAERFPHLLPVLLDGLAARGGDVLADLAASTHATVDARIVHVLRRLALPTTPTKPPAGGGLARLGVRLSHADVARLVGVERATVTRTLSGLEAAGLVAREHGHVVGVSLAHDGTR